MVERGPEKAGVGGSIPSLATIFNWQTIFAALLSGLSVMPAAMQRRLASAVRCRPFFRRELHPCSGDGRAISGRSGRCHLDVVAKTR